MFSVIGHDSKICACWPFGCRYARWVGRTRWGCTSLPSGFHCLITAAGQNWTVI